MLNRYTSPNLILTVTGGARHFDLQPYLLEQVRAGLEIAVKKTDAWIITGGLVRWPCPLFLLFYFIIYYFFWCLLAVWGWCRMRV